MNVFKKVIATILCIVLSTACLSVFAEESDGHAEPKFGPHNPHKVSDVKESLDDILSELEKELTIFGKISDYNASILANELLNLSSAIDIDDKKNKETIEDILEKTDELIKGYSDSSLLKEGESVTSFNSIDGIIYQIKQDIERKALIGQFEGYDPSFFTSESVSSLLNDLRQKTIDGLEKRASEVRKTPMIDTEQIVSDITFSDISPDDWFYDEVMEMTALGLFTGKGEIVNGVGLFAPNDIMSRAEFMAVICRMAFPYEDASPNGSWSKYNPYTGETIKSEAPWFSGYYHILNAKGIIDNMEISFYLILEKAISREEMAQISTNVLQTNGTVLTALDEFKNFNPEISIPDYSVTTKEYKNAVKVAYVEGFLQGIDDAGTFLPDGKLTRAEASVVLYRILKPQARIR